MVSAHMQTLFRHQIILALCLLLALAAPVAAAVTTELHIEKIAADGVTIIGEKTVDYRWLEQNLPIQGDGRTHYYHQGPVFEGDKWNPEEDVNVKEKDMGAVKGTDLKDICELVGGMGEEDTVRIRAVDGMSKEFPYRNVYEPEPRQGPMVITWYKADEGHVPDYYSGMRLVFFADTSTNPYDIHVFGVWDMRECFDEKYWYFYNGEYPTTTGLSVQYVSKITIYSDEEPVGSIHVNSTPAGATVILDDEETGYVTPCTLSAIEVGSHSVLVEREGFAQPDEKWVTVIANAVAEVDFTLTPEIGKIAISSVPTGASIFLDGDATGVKTDATLDDVPVGEHTIELVLSGYRNATENVTVEKDDAAEVEFNLILETTSDGDGSSDAETSINGSIAITSVPMNASIYLDGNVTGFRTDATLVNVSPGEHTIKLVLPGYRNATENVTVEKDDAAEVEFNLILETTSDGDGSSDAETSINGSIAITSVPMNASIYLDGNVTGFRTDATLVNVSPGEHTIKLVLPGYRNATRTVTVDEGGHVALDLILSRVGDEVEANAISHNEPTSGRPTPDNPVEAFIDAILSLVNVFFLFFGMGEATVTPLESTPVPIEGAETPTPAKTPVPPTQTLDEVRSTKNHSGGLYIDSYPPEMTISIDNKKLVWKTPQVAYGLREGLHTISIEESDSDAKMGDSGYRFEPLQAWVYPDAIAPAFLDGLTTRLKKTVRITSEAYRGEKFTVNGFFPASTIPNDAEIEGLNSWITVLWNGTYRSHAVPSSIATGDVLTVEPQDGDLVPISIRSDPAGAAVFIDGFPTGMVTPCQVDGLSGGYHRILVSMPGYLPAEEIIRIPEGAKTGGTITCTLREYTHGSLLVESTAPDAKIYLYGRYTGEKVPHTFSGMSIGTYEVRIVSENDSKTIDDVLVIPGGTTQRMVTLMGESR